MLLLINNFRKSGGALYLVNKCLRNMCLYQGQMFISGRIFGAIDNLRINKHYFLFQRQKKHAGSESILDSVVGQQQIMLSLFHDNTLLGRHVVWGILVPTIHCQQITQTRSIFSTISDLIILSPGTILKVYLETEWK